MSRLLGLTDAIVAALNAAPTGTFGLPFTAVRRLVVMKDLAKIGTALGVYVVGVGRIEERTGSVANFTGDYEVAIVVQQRLADGNNVRLQGDALEAKGEVLENLCEQLTDYLVGLKLTVTGINGTPVFKKVDGNPAYNISALHELGTFDSAQFLTCKAWKAVS